MTKFYSRLEKIALSDPQVLSLSLSEIITKRVSFRDFSQKPIAAKEISTLCYYSAGLSRPNPHDSQNPFRVYPSAGAKFPIEMYVFIQYGSDIPQGLYHYQPQDHSLDILLSPVYAKELKRIWIKQPWFQKASAIILLTSISFRTTQKYGALGAHFPFIEAGHMVQNMYLTATALAIGCCAIGQLQTHEVNKLIDLNEYEESFIYGVAIGN